MPEKHVWPKQQSLSSLQGCQQLSAASAASEPQYCDMGDTGCGGTYGASLELHGTSA
jgi:hypothetical protein